MRLLSLLAALCVVGSASPALAQKWPERTVRLVVPYPPGGNADVIGRVVAQSLQELLGQPFIIENKAGAGGMIGAEAVAKATPDGYTFLLSANGPILFAPEINKRKAYDWRNDFAPISTISLTPLVLLVHPSVPAGSLREFFDFARNQGDKLVFASGGSGTINHLFSELIQTRLNLRWTTVQYKGTAPAMTDLIAGHVQFGIDQISSSLSHIKGGRVRPLAVTGTKRAPWLPDVPTLVELGFEDMHGYTFAALVGPAGTPADIIAKLHAALSRILGDPRVAQKIRDMGAEAIAMTPEEFRRYLEREDATWIPIVRKADIGAN